MSIEEATSQWDNVYFLLSSCCNKCHPTTKQRYSRVGVHCTVVYIVYKTGSKSGKEMLEMTSSSSQVFQDLLSNYNIVELNDWLYLSLIK